MSNKKKERRTEPAMPPRNLDRRQKERGFSLIELLVVVAILLILVAIAVPNFARAKAAANTSSAAGSLKSIHQAAETYDSTFGVYPVSFAEMSSGTTAGTSACGSADDLPATWTGTPTLDGFVFTYGQGNGVKPSTYPNGCTDGFNGFSAVAVPSSNSTGNDNYCIDQTGVLYHDPQGPLGSGSLCASQPGATPVGQ